MQALTPREVQIAALIQDGLTFEEMGQQLGTSARSAKTETDEIRRKLGLRYKRQIPKVLRDLGIL